LDFGFIDKYRDIVVSQYQVDPYIFFGLVLLSTPFYYHSLYLIIKELRAIYKDKKSQVPNSKLGLDNKKLVNAVTYNFFAWLLPYAYVILFGKNLPIQFWVFFAFGLVLTLGLQFWRILKASKSS